MTKVAVVEERYLVYLALAVGEEPEAQLRQRAEDRWNYIYPDRPLPRIVIYPDYMVEIRFPGILDAYDQEQIEEEKERKRRKYQGHGF